MFDRLADGLESGKVNDEIEATVFDAAVNSVVIPQIKEVKLWADAGDLSDFVENCDAAVF